MIGTFGFDIMAFTREQCAVGHVPTNGWRACHGPLPGRGSRTRNACGRLRGPMSSWLSPSPRLSYRLGVFPILRTTLLGSVFLTLALLAGFAVHEPARP